MHICSLPAPLLPSLLAGSHGQGQGPDPGLKRQERVGESQEKTWKASFPDCACPHQTTCSTSIGQHARPSGAHWSRVVSGVQTAMAVCSICGGCGAVSWCRPCIGCGTNGRAWQMGQTGLRQRLKLTQRLGLEVEHSGHRGCSGRTHHEEWLKIGTSCRQQQPPAEERGQRRC